MKYLQVRAVLLVLILAVVGLMYYEWQRVLVEHRYSFKIAGLGPIGIAMGLYGLISPTRLGKPTTAGEKISVLLVIATGAMAGMVNLYLIDPSLFGR